MPNDKIDSVVLPEENGSTATYDIDLPVDATPSIASITTSGNATIGGTISEGGQLLSNKYQAKLTNPVTGTGSNGKITEWNSTNTVTNSNYSVDDIIAIAKGQTTGYVTNITKMPALATDNKSVTVTSFTPATGGNIPLSSFHIGDTIYLTEENYPDRWVSAVTSNNMTLTSLEAKTDLRDYSLKTHTHTYSTSSNVSVNGSYDKTTNVAISVDGTEGATSNYTPAGTIVVSRSQNVTLKTNSVTPFGSAGTLPTLETDTLTFNGGTAPTRESKQFNTDAIKAVNSTFTGTEGTVTVGSGASTYTPGGTISSITHGLGVNLGSNTTEASGIKYLEDASYSAGQEQTCVAIESVVEGSGSFYATRQTSGTGANARRSLSFTHTHISASAGDENVVLTSIGSPSITKTTKYFHPQVTGSINTPTFTGTSVRLVYTPAGNINNTYTDASKDSVYSITNLGTVATLKKGNADVAEFKAVNAFAQGTLPSGGTAVTVATGEVENQPAFTGTFTGTGTRLVTTITNTSTSITSTGTVSVSGTTSADTTGQE